MIVILTLKKEGIMPIAASQALKYRYYAEQSPDDDCFIAHVINCAAFKHLRAHGETEKEATINLIKAVILALKTMQDQNQPFPEPTTKDLN